MRIPLPNNKLVAFTLAGALLTAVVAGGLAMPGVGLGQAGGDSDSPGTPASDASQQAAADAPTPNEDFTPAVQTQSGYEDEAHEEDEAYGDEAHEESESHEEDEAYEDDEAHEDDDDHEDEYEAGDEDGEHEEDE
ncbi:hypothetical protein ACOZ4L_12155 [Haloplanus ruber]|uniref:Uncharacterized protein n=1 Tax=Haloplanus ruber TaxID=869892 RepID=A0ABD6CXR5_9EURY|nr:hypothetical protein [Haloplanus ruber]